MIEMDHYNHSLREADAPTQVGNLRPVAPAIFCRDSCKQQRVKASIADKRRLDTDHWRDNEATNKEL